MSLHFDGPPATNLEEVMDQFICDSGGQDLERQCEQAARRFDWKAMQRVMPGLTQEQFDSMKGWHGHCVKFMKYRNQVSEKHERQMKLRMHRKNKQVDVWDDFDDDDTESDAINMSHAPSVRSEAPSVIGQKSPTNGPLAGRRRPSIIDRSSIPPSTSPSIDQMDSSPRQVPAARIRRPSTGMSNDIASRQESAIGLGPSMRSRRPSIDNGSNQRMAGASPVPPTKPRRPSIDMSGGEVTPIPSAASRKSRQSSKLPVAGASVVRSSLDAARFQSNSSPDGGARSPASKHTT